MIVFRLLSLLLRYPEDGVLAAREEILAAAHELPESPAKQAILYFLAYWYRESNYALQQRYTATFDFNRRGSLYLTYYRHGDMRSRGEALLEVKSVYERAGYRLDTTELPDYLPLVLEFAAAEPEAGLELLASYRGTVEVIRRSLRHDRSPYALLLDALITFLPELDAAAEEEMRRLIVQGPPQETVGLEPYGSEPPGKQFAAFGGGRR